MTPAWCFDAFGCALHPDCPDFGAIDLSVWDVCETIQPLDLDPAGLGGIVILHEPGASIPPDCTGFLVAALDRGEVLAVHAHTPEHIGVALAPLYRLSGGGNA